MKLELDIMKSILEKIEEEHKGERYKYQFTSGEDFKLEYYNFGLLFDGGFINGEKKTSVTSGTPSYQIDGLTMEGHELLGVLANKPLLSKVKEVLKDIGINTFKLIPSIAAQILLSKVGN